VHRVASRLLWGGGGQFPVPLEATHGSF